MLAIDLQPRLPILVASAFLALLARAEGQDQGVVSPSKPRTVYLIGDSTVKNGDGSGKDRLWGWGNFLADSLDEGKAVVKNRARGGRSSRTYFSEGLWEEIRSELKPGDVVLIQFGHNDGGPIDTGRARASLKGIGDESKDVVVEATKKAETVRTYGWYLKKYVADARAKGATPIVLSPVPRNGWDASGKVNRASKDYGKWAAEVAKSEGTPFVDLNEIVARHYEQEGKEKVESAYFTSADHTHTTEAGARLNAACVVEGLQSLPFTPLSDAWKAPVGLK